MRFLKFGFPLLKSKIEKQNRGRNEKTRTEQKLQFVNTTEQIKEYKKFEL
jgi:hypothetical protein